jgi:hypothetical protein
MQAWGNAPGKSSPKRALKVRIKEAFASVPHIAFIKFDAEELTFGVLVICYWLSVIVALSSELNVVR